MCYSRSIENERKDIMEQSLQSLYTDMQIFYIEQMCHLFHVL